MDFTLRIFLMLLIVIGIICVYKTIKKKKLSMKYGMYFSVIFGCMLILIIFPSIIECLATFLGFKEAPNMIFLIAIFILFYITFAIYTTITKLSENNKILVQELSMLKKELEDKKISK